MKAGRHSNSLVRFGAILALGVLAVSVAEAASATGQASATILSSETISLTSAGVVGGSSRFKVENHRASGFLSLKVRSEVPLDYKPSVPDGGLVLRSDRPAEIDLSERSTSGSSEALIVIYHHF
jgi:hypothetical protein